MAQGQSGTGKGTESEASHASAEVSEPSPAPVAKKKGKRTPKSALKEEAKSAPEEEPRARRDIPDEEARKLISPLAAKKGTKDHATLESVHYNAKAGEMVASDGRALGVLLTGQGSEAGNGEGIYPKYEVVIPGYKAGALPDPENIYEGKKPELVDAGTYKLSWLAMSMYDLPKSTKKERIAVTLYTNKEAGSAVAIRRYNEAPLTQKEIDDDSVIGIFDSAYLRAIEKFLWETGDDFFTLYAKDAHSPALFVGKNAYCVVMPIRTSYKERTAPRKSLRVPQEEQAKEAAGEPAAKEEEKAPALKKGKAKPKPKEAAPVASPVPKEEGAKPKPAADIPQEEYDAVVKQYTSEDGTRRRGWMLAPNGKPTKLTERQWVQVRTPSFKKWFGDWEALRELTIPSPSTSLQEARTALTELVGKNITNLETGITAKIGTVGRNKILSNKALQKSLANGFTSRQHNSAAAHIATLWKHATLVQSRPDKNGDVNILSIKRFATPVIFSGEASVSYITAKETLESGHRIYSLELMEIKELQRQGGTPKERTTAGVQEDTLSRLLEKVNPDSVSKIVDENGEPMVVYHGSPNYGFTVFDEGLIGKRGWTRTTAGFHFTPKESHARNFGKERWAPIHISDSSKVYPVFLNARNPTSSISVSTTQSKVDGSLIYYDRSEVQPLDHPSNLIDIAVFSPNQIKSATDNTGAFDAKNDDIRYSPKPASQPPIPHRGLASTGTQANAQPVSKQAIVDQFKKLFPELAIRGRATFRKKGVLGWFDPKNSLIRTNDPYAIEVIAHELGHYIDNLTDSALPPSVRDELTSAGEALYGEKKPAISYRSEGWAEFIRGWMMNEDLADIVPNTLTWFNLWLADNPDTAKKLIQLQGMVKTAQQQRPEDEVRGFRTHKDPSWFTSKIAARFSYHALVDKFDFLLKDMTAAGIDIDYHALKGKNLHRAILRNPYLLTTLYNKSAGRKTVEMALTGTTNLIGNRSTGEGLVHALENIVGDQARLDAWINYAVARQAAEYRKRGMQSGLSDAAIDGTISKYQSPEFDDALERVTQWSRRILHLLVESGAMTEADYQKIEETNPIYIRFMRRFAEDEVNARRLKQGKTVHRRKGGTQGIESPIAAMLVDAQRIITMAQEADIARAIVLTAQNAPSGSAVAKNWIVPVPAPKEAVTIQLDAIKEKIASIAVDQMEANPHAAEAALAKDWTDSLTIFQNSKDYKGKEKIVKVVIDGEPQFYQVGSDKLFKMWEGLSDKPAETAFGKINDTVMNTIRMGATMLSPRFGLLRNPLRDAATAAIFADYHTHLPVISTLAGVIKDLTGAPIANLYHAMGLDLDTLSGQNLKAAKNLEKQVVTPNKAARELNAGIFRALAKLLGVAEVGPRLMEFQGALNYWKERLAGAENDDAAA